MPRVAILFIPVRCRSPRRVLLAKSTLRLEGRKWHRHRLARQHAPATEHDRSRRPAALDTPQIEPACIAISFGWNSEILLVSRKERGQFHKRVMPSHSTPQICARSEKSLKTLIERV